LLDSIYTGRRKPEPVQVAISRRSVRMRRQGPFPNRISLQRRSSHQPTSQPVERFWLDPKGSAQHGTIRPARSKSGDHSLRIPGCDRQRCRRVEIYVPDSRIGRVVIGSERESNLAGKANSENLEF